MCGIAGFTQFHQAIGDEEMLVAMGEAIRHRGPDASASYIEGAVGLHHRRLSIIDLSEAGNQPMHSHCGRYVIVFNGEIYNFLELRRELEQQSYPFQTQSDTEVILALYSQQGRQCVDQLNGMFAFALWDLEAQTLFLARDRIGKKPLYYSFKDDDIVFASELKALLSTGLIERNIRLDALYDYFAYQYVPDPKTIFEGVYKLEPGHWLEVSAAGHHKQQYWDLSFSNEPISEEDARQALREHIDAATKRRMIADVPLGAFLSGGVDSSGIVATMARHSPTAITTCAIGFDEERFNETEFAQIVAERYQTDHHEFTVSENVADTLEGIARFFDEPFADPSSVPTYFVSKLARQKVTVALAGDGGDEVFAGYQKYAIDAIENRWRERFPLWVRKLLFPGTARLFRNAPLKAFRRAATFLDALAKEPALAFYQSNAQITDAQWQALSGEETQQKLANYHPSTQTVDAYRRCTGPDHLAKILYTDIKTYLPGDILVKVDRMSMAHSLEVRAPLLDYQLMSFAGSLSSAFKYRKGEKKYLLKEVFSQDLPDEILYRKKMGFSPPLAEWFRGELRELAEAELLNSDDGLPRYFKIDAVRALWQDHQSGARDHGALLWSLLMFQLWWNVYMVNT